MDKSTLVLVAIFFVFMNRTVDGRSHIITFRSHNLFPESLTWDATAQHFVVGSLRHPILQSISDAAVVNTLINDASLPSNSSFLGVAIDPLRRRVLAVVHANSQSPSYNALAAYDLQSRQRLFLTTLNDPASTSPTLANDVVVDFSGNAYVTNSARNFIWKVNLDGEGSIFSKSKSFSSHPVIQDMPYSPYGLNGVVYISKGYLLVVQSNTGKLFKVDIEDGTARTVLLNKDLLGADGVAVRKDGVVVVVSKEKVYFIKSQNSWSEGVVYDETALDAKKFATSVTVGGGERVYVLYGHVDEGMMGNVERESFRIEQIMSDSENADEPVWLFVIIGLALAYFFFWRFQMRALVTNMNKKIA